MKGVSGKRIVAVAQARGWVLASMRGSHAKLRNPITGESVIVPIHANRDLHPGMQRKLMRDLRLTDADL